ncbi:MAG: sigma-54-dependent transcriptional response regulator PilR [Pseudomonadota bacterium]|jgi:two-component system response regulator PilR (NtrC family)
MKNQHKRPDEAARTSTPTGASPGPSIELWHLVAQGVLVLSVVAVLNIGANLAFAPISAATRYGWYLWLAAYVGIVALNRSEISHSLRWLAEIGGDLADLITLTGFVYLTGGPFSPFLFLYLPLVGLAAIRRTRGAGLWYSLGAALTYGSLAGALRGGALTLADGSLLPSDPPGGVGLQLIGLTSGMVLTVIGASFLARRLTTSSVLAAQSSALADEQRELLERIPDGIVRLRLDGTIDYLNDAAASLLDSAPALLTGSSLVAHLREHGADYDLDLSPKESLTTYELQLSTADPRSVRHITCIARPCFNARRELTGSFVIIRDETTLRTAQEQLEIQERMARLLAASGEDESLHRHYTRIKGFVGESAVMQRIFTLIERVANFDATVLISGESGTGKELVARAIHLGGPHGSGPFVPVNCGAIPENLIESELFGHKRGAFTGAETDALGLFRRADGGTIFLDEIGELPLALQAKLLRVLQERTVRPVGSDTDIPIRVRVVAATNRNLRDEVRADRFREDLFYRLNVVNIALPPLRERREDIPPLVDALLRQLSHGKAALPVVPPATMRLLMSYDYPGNVRELENILERAQVFGGEVILPEHLPEHLRGEPERLQSAAAPKRETEIVFTDNIEFPLNLDAVLADTERRYLELALVRTNGAKKKAADLLGLNFRSFRYRLQKFNIANDGE